MTGNQLAEFKRIVKKVDNIKYTELVSTEKKKEAIEAKKEAAEENAALEKTVKTVNEKSLQTSEAEKTAEKVNAESKNKGNAIVLPQKSDVFSIIAKTKAENPVLNATEEKEKAAETVEPIVKEVSESAATETENNKTAAVSAVKKPIYPPRTPAKKKQITNAENLKALNLVRSLTSKPKRK